MQLDDATIQFISTLAASLLSEWIGLSPIAKSNNGDDTPTGGIALFLGAMLASKAPPPPANAADRMAKYIAADIARRRDRDSLWMTYDVDYGPGRELSDLAKSCEIASSWPIKSGLTITMYNGRVSVQDRRGYGDEGLTYYLEPGRGWLVSPANIDRRLMPTVIAAVDAGTIDSGIAHFKPFE